MTAAPVEPHGRRAALGRLVDVLYLCLAGRPRRDVLGYAPSGHIGPARHAARWRALFSAVTRVVRPAPHAAPPTIAHWTLTREDGGWALRPARSGGPPTHFTADVPADDQNAAFDWAGDVTPDVDRKRISYAGPPPA
jgi:hypothetical protein